MKITKRIFLFLLTNFLIIATLSIVLNLFGVRPYLNRAGIDYVSLAFFCVIWGFGGAFISLLISRIMAKWAMGVQLIDPHTTDPKLREILVTVYRLAERVGIQKMPEVGFYESPEINAFATGPTQNRALVAVSTGLLDRMGSAEMEGVLAHEVSHVANGDMVTMTLVQGVVNSFVMFFARIIAFAVSQLVNNKDMRPLVNMLVTIVLDILLGFLGLLVVTRFSRWREFRADRGGANLAGREKMIAALHRLKLNLEIPSEDRAPSLASFKISSRRGGIFGLLSTHPSLDERIARLQSAK
jgi:heat shock protein HtpX